MKEGLGTKNFCFKPLSYSSRVDMCPDHISTGLVSPYSFLHPLTELLKLFKGMMKSFHDTLEISFQKVALCTHRISSVCILVTI